MTYEVRCVDFRDALADVESEYDAIVTDPPYARKYVSLAEACVRLAPKVLVPGGHLLMMTGHLNIEYLMKVAASVGLRYRWILAVHNQKPAPATMNMGLKIVNQWKPVVWWTNGTMRRPDRLAPDSDLFLQPPPVGKKVDDWAQGTKWAEFLLNVAGVRPGDKVLDPMMGAGYVVKVAHERGCYGVGFDYQQELVDKVRIWLEGGSNV